MKNSVVKLICAVFFIALIAGCSNVKKVNLLYSPTDADIKGCAGKVTILPFEDNRTDKSLGKAPVSVFEPTSSVAEWMQNAMIQELDKAGCITQVSSSVPDTGLAVQGFVEETYLYQPAMASFKAKSQLRLKIYQNGNLAYINTYQGRQRLDATTTSREQALTQELQSIMGFLVPEIIGYAN
ncbi:MAG: hypothetical protein EOM25_02310 [Deltaproteobacteria bacterium]|nr:hypothetical protein [Deltaproteobacteria bacterium]